MSIEKFKNIIDKDILGTNMMLVSLFVTVYENFCDFCEERVKNFLCYQEIKESKMVIIETEEYKTQIKDRLIDGKYKDKLKSTILWFVDNGAIIQNDYDIFLKIKEKRNTYVHEMFEQLLEGVSQSDIHLFCELLLLYRKIDKWWINEIEIAFVDYEISTDYDRDAVKSGNFIVLEMMLQVLFFNKSPEYKEMYEKVMSIYI
jgi:hypothetical protein